MNSKLSGLTTISIVVATLMGSSAAIADQPTQNVLVTNSTTNPVPVKGTGANGTVPVSGNVGVTGTVGISGNVGITGMPAVTISGTPSVNIANTPTVNVGNSPTPGQLVNVFSGGNSPVCVDVNIPGGMVLIVKRVSVSTGDGSFPNASGFIGISTANSGSVGLRFLSFDGNGNASYDFEYPAGLVVASSQQTICSQVNVGATAVGHFMWVNGYLASFQ